MKMTERERLIELLKSDSCQSPMLCDPNCKYANLERCYEERTADYLLASGVRVLPVKAGDKIYEICERRKGEKWVKIISERVVHGVEIGINGSMTARCGTTISVFLSDIGKTVFLTREEAENALKERENNA